MCQAAARRRGAATFVWDVQRDSADLWAARGGEDATVVCEMRQAAARRRADAASRIGSQATGPWWWSWPTISDGLQDAAAFEP